MGIETLDQLSGTDTLETGVCIVGSGPAGGVLAASLARGGIDVLVLECGGEMLNEAKDTVDEDGSSAQAAGLRFGWSKQLGGSSNLWAGRTCPLEGIDFDQRDWVEDSGWPFKRRDLEPYYRDAAKIVRIPPYDSFYDNDYARADMPALSPVLGDGSDVEAKCFLWASKPFDVAGYLKAEVNDSPRLRVLLNARVSKIVENPDGQKIDALEVARDGAAPLRVTARVFILAAGGLEIPRMLLNARDVRENGIGNDHDTVGRYFSTHPKADMAAIIFNKRQNCAHPLFSDCSFQGGSIRYGVGFSEEAQRQHKLLNHYVQLSPIMEYQANRAFEAMKNTKALDYSMVNNNALMQGMLPGLGKIAYEAMGRLAGLQPKTKKFILRGFLDQYPDRENRVMLSEDKAEDGSYKAKIDWRFTQRDKDSVISFFDLLDQNVRAANIGHIEYSVLREKDDWPITGIHSHFMGTTRMGNDPKTSVTDADAKVHGYGNLYISGPSLFPAYGYANPFLTITALALRLSDHLLSALKH